jgi:hypothetical protein
MPRALEQQWSANVRVAVAVVDASSNHACAMCPTVVTGETRPLLLEHHRSDGTAATARTEGYRILVQRRITVVTHASLLVIS